MSRNGTERHSSSIDLAVYRQASFSMTTRKGDAEASEKSARRCSPPSWTLNMGFIDSPSLTVQQVSKFAARLNTFNVLSHLHDLDTLMNGIISRLSHQGCKDGDPEGVRQMRATLRPYSLTKCHRHSHTPPHLAYIRRRQQYDTLYHLVKPREATINPLVATRRWWYWREFFDLLNQLKHHVNE